MADHIREVPPYLQPIMEGLRVNHPDRPVATDAINVVVALERAGYTIVAAALNTEETTP